MFGSFLNVCILRLPVDQSLVRPRSRCPKCETMVAWYDNLPVVSWLILGGKCRHCREPISIQYPLIELVVGGLWAAAVWRYGLNVTALSAAIFGTILLGIAMTDARHYIIPDEFTWGGLAIGLALSLTGGLPSLLTAVIGAATGFAILYFVAWAGQKALGKEAMGGGDIKMMAMVGSFVGWDGVLLTIFGGSLLGTLIFLPLRLMGKNILVPFGVFLAAAAAGTFVFGEDVLRWYVGYLNG
jgi:leader peptidase (prepilin peptidase)/N-methyltransferase